MTDDNETPMFEVARIEADTATLVPQSRLADLNERNRAAYDNCRELWTAKTGTLVVPIDVIEAASVGDEISLATLIEAAVSFVADAVTALQEILHSFAEVVKDVLADLLAAFRDAFATNELPDVPTATGTADANASPLPAPEESTIDYSDINLGPPSLGGPPRLDRPPDTHE
jgi:hypothetical protein